MYKKATSVNRGGFFVHTPDAAKKSGQRDSNSRLSAWEANALPTELCPQKRRCKVRFFIRKPYIFCIYQQLY
jgi:hypothetical protein